jgi:heme oxygenase
LHAVHLALETTVVGTSSEDVFFAEMIRTPALLRDLKHWGYELENLDVMPETLETCDLIRDTIANDPIAAIGFIYVLEGSRMGSLVIVKPLAKALNVTPTDAQGLDYHTEGARQTPARLARWKAEVEQRDWSEERIASVESAAVNFMESLNRLYAMLPAPPKPNQQVQADAA